MKRTRIYDLTQTNREQREVLDKKEETIKALKQQDIETRLSFYETLQRLSNIGHSDDNYKNIHMLDIIDKTIKEMWEDLKIDLFVENDEESKIKELVSDYQSLN